MRFKSDIEEAQWQPKGASGKCGSISAPEGGRRGGPEAQGAGPRPRPRGGSPESPALDRPARRKCHRGVTGGGPICKENLWPNTLRYFLRTSRRDHRPGQCPSLKFTENKATQPNDFGHDKQMEQTLD